MDSREEKKLHERFLLDEFLKRQGITPTSIVGGESPDFLITLDGRVIGVEVTELRIRKRERGTHPQLGRVPLLQELEDRQNKIVSKAREIYTDLDNPPIQSKIWLSDQIPLDKKEGYLIAHLIADQVINMSRPDSGANEWRSCGDEEGNPLSEWVSLISVCRAPAHLARWTAEGAGVIASLNASRIQKEIDKKAFKLDAYKKWAREIWLLMVADRTRPSQLFSLTPDFNVESISSPFAKTFYFDLVHGQVLRFEESGTS